MFDSVARDIERGVDKIKWFAKTLSERVVVECSAVRLLYRTEELRRQRDELLRRIGQEVYEMRGKEGNVYANLGIMHAIREIEILDSEIHETSEKVSEAGRTPR